MSSALNGDDVLNATTRATKQGRWALAGLLVLTGSIPARAQPPPPDESCSFPSVVVEGTEYRTIARAGFIAFEAHRDDAFESAPCIRRYREFLRDVAHAQKAAGLNNPAALKHFQAKELEVRLKLFEELNATDLPRTALAIYKNNLRRLRDLYQFQHNGKAFLDDIIAADVNFNAVGSRVVEVREGVRTAIYSCDRWNFTHAANPENMRPQWKAGCQTEFANLGESIPQFAQIAPAAARFAREEAAVALRAQALPAREPTPPTADSATQQGEDPR